MSSTQYDLGNLFIKIGEVPKGVDIVSHFPELSVFKEFTSTDDFIVRVAILSSDIESPFIRIRDRDVMIKAIFDFLGKKDTDLQDSIISYEYQPYLFAWLKYLEILNETEYTDWQLGKKQYAYSLLKANEAKRTDEDDVQYMKRFSAARKQVKELGEELRSLEAELFPDSKAAKMAAIAEQAKKVKLYPEMYADEYQVA